jgi:hypothetical protein
MVAAAAAKSKLAMGMSNFGIWPGTGARLLGRVQLGERTSTLGYKAVCQGVTPKIRNFHAKWKPEGPED